MRLSQIRLTGFKSFVDPTHIPTPGRIVGIVGPNGCGKSNIIDALRWVLGESKASALRGKSMQDVIFNGSENRKPVARASVELVFDNSLGRAAGQWSSYAEIAVKRVLQRDAESSYYINSIRVRRKDVSDIFLGTGLGGHAYAIIEQGMISRIIEADPEELKVFLEEAAGISKYRERRRETELHLQATRDNLLRVEDIVEELRKQTGHLESQARIANIYRELQDALKTAQHLLWLRDKLKAGQTRAKLLEEATQLQLALESETANLRHIENRLVAMRDEVDLAGQVLQDAQGRMYQSNSEVSRLQQQIDHVKGNRSRTEARIAAAKAELDALDLQHLDAARARHQMEIEISEARKRSASCALELERLEAERVKAGIKAGEAKKMHEESRIALSEADQAQKVEQAHWQHIEKSLDQIEGRRKRLLQSRLALVRPDEAALAMLNSEMEQNAILAASEKDACGKLEKRLEEIKPQWQEDAQTLREQEKRLAELRARLAALSEMQSGLESDLRQWLDENGFEGLPRLRSSLRISAGWENALESVLREKVNAVLMDESLHNPPHGEAVFVRSGELTSEPAKNRLLDSLLDLVEFDEQAFGGALSDWLSSCYVAKSLEAAQALQSSLNPGEFLVTPEGHVLTRYSLHVYGTDSKLRGVLLRQQEIESLQASCADAVLIIEAARKRHEAHREEISSLESAIKEKTGLVSGLERSGHNLQLKLVGMEDAISRWLEQSGRIDAELCEVDALLGSESERKLAIAETLQSLLQAASAARERLKSDRQELAAAESLLEERSRLVQQAAGKSREAEFQEKTCVLKADELRKRIDFLSDKIEQGRRDLGRLGEEASSLDSSPFEAQLQTALADRIVCEEALLEARRNSEALFQGLKELDAARQNSEMQLGPLRERIAETRLREQEARLAEEQFDAWLKAENAKLGELALMLDKAPESRQLHSEISRLKGRIESLGAVNLAAFEELKAARERKGYLDAQISDLSEAVETLESAIRRIDRDTRERLMSTYEAVNGHFSELFGQLFGGGKARLVLTGEQIIDSGVEIEAQPPGKKNASIRLLSGGEKALTALGLVFSFFRLNPAPFCLLDEVDAPLDDSNTERFCDMVRRMSEHTQFLFISHNKITMEIAQQLIGVTMQEQGVSRIVAVDVEAASIRTGIMAN